MHKIMLRDYVGNENYACENRATSWRMEPPFGDWSY